MPRIDAEPHARCAGALPPVLRRLLPPLAIASLVVLAAQLGARTLEKVPSFV
jgi:hypothetical protein